MIIFNSAEISKIQSRKSSK
jgi:hypothetical protein